MRYYQKSTKLLIRKLPFTRLVKNTLVSFSANVTKKNHVTIKHTQVKEISNNATLVPFRWTCEALFALQIAAEDLIVHLMEDTNLCALHAKRVTISALNKSTDAL